MYRSVRITCTENDRYHSRWFRHGKAMPAAIELAGLHAGSRVVPNDDDNDDDDYRYNKNYNHNDINHANSHHHYHDNRFYHDSRNYHGQDYNPNGAPDGFYAQHCPDNGGGWVACPGSLDQCPFVPDRIHG